jgi:hypothetical protein
MAVSDEMLEKIQVVLRRVSPERLADVLQFIEFIEYQTRKQAQEADTSEDEALWAAVEANRAFKAQHPGEMIVHESGDDFLAATSDH